MDYSPTGGGTYGGDWTHLNDVEELPDGRYVASLRNQDQVVFIDPQQGLLEEWTLGTDDNHEVLYEQHNPDYIPRERGGPAVLVADSENNRVVEYQRVNGRWKQTWAWTNDNVRWPRDADRLSNNNTLITVSNGNRVIEVDQSGEVVWKVAVNTPYEAERIHTGDESHSGNSARAANLQSPGTKKDTVSRESSSLGTVSRFKYEVRSIVPNILINGLLFVLPIWIGFEEFIFLVVLLCASMVWVATELYWRGYRLRVPVQHR